MDSIIRIPPDQREFIKPQLSRLLNSYVSSRDFPRCLLAFAGNEQIELGVKTDPDWLIVFARLNEGLIGQAFQSDEIKTSADADSHFRRGDPQTQFEIAASVPYKNGRGAVVLIDYFGGEILERYPFWKVNKLRQEVGRILRSIEDEHRDTSVAIQEITDTAVRVTKSLRGFTAIIKWDGTIRYFTAGKDVDKFKYLNQLEGLCGEVLMTGEPLCTGNVWSTKNYHSSDNSILSEAIEPIRIDGEVVGVLNMESDKRDHYTSDDVRRMSSAAEDMSDLARRWRTPAGAGLGPHSRLLSDLVEKFSVDTATLGDDLDSGTIRDWALRVCRNKVAVLEDVKSVSYLDPAAFEEEVGKPVEKFRKAVDEPPEPVLIKTKDGGFMTYFQILREGAVLALLRVEFKSEPEMAMKEIISQFCRLTGNEIRRRGAELRLVVFEHLVAMLRTSSTTEIALRLPHLLKRMLDCDDCSFFACDTYSGATILRLWSSTSSRRTVRGPEPFYRVNSNDGLTGFAATRRDPLVIHNVLDESELRAIDPALSWSRKIGEGDDHSVRSFFAIPIHRSTGLTGLIRGHRSVVGRNIAFTETDTERLRQIQFLLERVLKEEIVVFADSRPGGS